MADIHDKLKGLLASGGIMAGNDWKNRISELQEKRAAGTFEIDQVVPGRVVGEDDDAFYLVQEDFPLDTPRGCVTLGEALEAAPEHISLGACDETLADFDARRAVFVDAETTGLAGGSGTLAFLFGLGYFTETAFRVEQCFLRDYYEEEPMLHYIAPLLERFDTVVSYNGKSFDMPLLRTRFIANRTPFPVPEVRQLDLLHVARRFFKLRVKDCSLSSIERTVLGVERHGDVPGCDIPDLYFDYLRTRDARRLDRVFYHHQCDIISLAALTGHMARCVSHPEGDGFDHAEDRLSMLRVQFRLKRYEEVLRIGRRLLEDGLQGDLLRECLEKMAAAAKRSQNAEEEKSSLEYLARDFPEHIEGQISFAKFCEHRLRDLARAEQICAVTLERLEIREALGRLAPFEYPYLSEIRRRLDRIRVKQERGRPKDGAE